MEPLDPATVRRSFVNTSRSRAAAMNLPRPWPPARLEDRDFLGWIDPKAPQRAYLVLPSDEHVATVELRLAEPPPGRRRTLCDWCHADESDVEARLVVAQRAGSRGRQGDSVGVYVCADFDCSLRARTPLKRHQRSVSGAPDLRIEQLRERVASFLARVTEPA